MSGTEFQPPKSSSTSATTEPLSTTATANLNDSENRSETNGKIKCNICLLKKNKYFLLNFDSCFPYIIILLLLLNMLLVLSIICAS